MPPEYSPHERAQRLAQVLQTLEEDESLVLVLRSHLWLENRLNAILEAAVRFPADLDLDRVGFELKVKFARAFGLIWPELANAILAANRLRNRFAHRLETELTEDVVREFYSSFPDELRQGWTEPLDFSDPRRVAAQLLGSLYLSLEGISQMAAGQDLEPGDWGAEENEAD